MEGGRERGREGVRERDRKRRLFKRRALGYFTFMVLSISGVKVDGWTPLSAIRKRFRVNDRLMWTWSDATPLSDPHQR